MSGIFPGGGPEFEHRTNKDHDSFGGHHARQRAYAERGAVVEVVFSLALAAFVSGIVGAFVSSVVASIKSQGHKAQQRATEERTELESMKAGIRALLWCELERIHSVAMSKGGLTVDQRRHLESVYSAYHGLGGNGTGTRLFQDSMEMQVID